VFSPLRTDRLLIRAVDLSDVEPLFERRNDPDVARAQAWATPYPRSEAEALVADTMAMEGPTTDEWWTVSIVLADTGETIGDLVVHLTNDGRTAEVGYTLASRHWGNGYAVEALEALVAWLFETLPLTRAWAMLHPDNRASAMVLERTGFLFEGHTRLSFWLGEDNSDDHIYGMTRPEWEAWRTRPLHPPTDVRLVPITLDNAWKVHELRTHKSQEAFVATMAESYADALFPEIVDGAPVVPWMRAVEADGELVGFVMLALVTEHHPEPFLWRLLIERLHQRRGIATRVLDLVADQCRAMGATTLLTSWGEGKGSPNPFYRSRGFEPTGRLVDGETEARMALV
jgi:RimJ/RimL family protein N-acetyltransferase